MHGVLFSWVQVVTLSEAIILYVAIGILAAALIVFALLLIDLAAKKVSDYLTNIKIRRIERRLNRKNGQA